MQQNWRWFGPSDIVCLPDAKQAGATGIVTALHHIPTGNIWEKSEIIKRKSEIEHFGLEWSVAESIPVHENIKTRSGNYRQLIDHYKTSIVNLGSCGVPKVCYNFMPVLDATRTDFKFKLADGSVALLFDATAFAAFELFLLKRKGAKELYDEDYQKKAADYLNKLSKHQVDSLISTVVAGFPGVGTNYTLEEFQQSLDNYKEISAAVLKENLQAFLGEIIPVAEEAGIKMAIHPDDPPFPVLGLPRIVSTESDIEDVLNAYESQNNGFCLCTGSLGVLKSNDLPGIVKRLGSKLNFVHLRNIKRLGEDSFFESAHLSGEVDMYEVVKSISLEERRRKKEGIQDSSIPMRPDHGLEMLDDLHKKSVPGYSAIGRLKGLAEMRGLELAINKALEEKLID